MRTIKLTALAFGLAVANVLAQNATENDDPKLKVSGMAEFDAYANASTGDDQKIYHSYKSKVDVDFQAQFNENWSAQVGIEGYNDDESPSIKYRDAFVQYKKGNFAVKLGDLAFSEGKFTYYNFNDSTVNAAGMREKQVRGIELDYYGLQFGIGFGRGDWNDIPYYSTATYDDDEEWDDYFYPKSYDIHLAYQFDIAGQTFRPFIHYKSWQKGNANELHTGLNADLAFGPLGVHAVYGLHADRLKKSFPNATHAFLAEPTLDLGRVIVKAGAFFAIIDDNSEHATIHYGNDFSYEIPEYKFAYGEVDFKANDAFTAGLVGEWHTNTIDNTKELGSFEIGPRFYFNPFKNLEVTGFAKAIIPVGDDWKKEEHYKWISLGDYDDDVLFSLGLETVFRF